MLKESKVYVLKDDVVMISLVETPDLSYSML